jgi:hypothetical protein
MFQSSGFAILTTCGTKGTMFPRLSEEEQGGGGSSMSQPTRHRHSGQEASNRGSLKDRY